MLELRDFFTIPLASAGVFFLLRLVYRIVKDRIRTKKVSKRFSLDDRERYGLTEIYKDSKGRRWYSFANPVRMPAVRAIYCEIATRQAEMNLTQDSLEKFLIRIIDFMNQGEFVNAAHTVSEVKARLTEACEESTLLALAGYYFILEGENPETVVDDWIEKKREIWEEDADAKAFFLLASYRVTGKLSAISESDILGYLAEAQAKRQRKPIR